MDSFIEVAFQLFKLELYHRHFLEMLTKWCQPTRLETRTKESNICASILVAKTKIIKQSNIIRNESEKEKGISLSFEVGRVLKKKLRAPAPLTDLDLISIGKRFE